jgi:Tat protein secretion system quality control protein TatD with DNase activity
VDGGGRLRKPMFLHERNAQDDLFAILGEFAGHLPPVVCHCFTGSTPGTCVVRCRAIMAATISNLIKYRAFFHTHQASQGRLSSMFSTCFEETTKRMSLIPIFDAHCVTAYAHSARAELARILDAGFFVGITGFVAMRERGEALRSIVATIPLDRLMVHTRAPIIFIFGVFM